MYNKQYFFLSIFFLINRNVSVVYMIVRQSHSIKSPAAMRGFFSKKYVLRFLITIYS